MSRANRQVLGIALDDIDPDAPECEELCTIMAEPVHGDGRYLYRTWREVAARDVFRVGRDVPSRTLAPLLSHLALYEPVPDCDDYRARVTGFFLVRRLGRDMTGHRLSRLCSVFRCHPFETLRRVEMGQACVVDVQVLVYGELRLHFELVALPAVARDGTSPAILAGVFYHDWRPVFGRPAGGVPGLRLLSGI